LSGTVHSSTDRNPLINANVVAISTADSTKREGTVTDKKGAFTITDLQKRSYRVKISYLGFRDLDTVITLRGASESIGKVYLLERPVALQAVEIVSVLPTVEQKEDTLIYNSRSFKTNPDATAEDLVSKMPGITVDKSGTVTAQGQQVQRVKVDGRQFFGDDASSALRNLPADMIDKVQVYDELSDQSRLTGFDDGQAIRAMNLITKMNRRNGVFGKFYGGYGNEDRYQAGTTLNYWDGDSRLTLLGMSNNINQQNFSFQDILGVMGGGGGDGGMFRQFSGAIQAGMRFLGGAGGRGGGMFGRGGGGGGGPLSDFFVGQQGGLNTTHSIGTNFSNNWGESVLLTGSYFFNYGKNSSHTLLDRQYFASNDTAVFYNEDNTGGSTNQNHRINARLEITADSLNSFVYQPRLTVQNSSSASAVLGGNSLNQLIALSSTSTTSSSDVNGFTLSNNLVYRHRFHTQGRSFSVNLNTSNNTRDGESYTTSLSDFFSGTLTTRSVTDQQSLSKTKGYTLSGNASYTEPLFPDGLLQLSYNASYTNNSNDKKTYQYDSLAAGYSTFDAGLSNVLKSGYLTHRPGIGLRYRVSEWNAQVQVDYQVATLDGTQTFPLSLDIARKFYTFLPRVEFNWRPSQTDNINIRYSTRTNPPSVTQLQDVVDNSNPLQLSTGNPNLRQDFSHNANIRFTHSSTDRTRTLFGFLMGGITDDYIGNTTILAAQDTVLTGGVKMARGSQLTYPVNLNGYRSMRSLLAYSFPLTMIQSNINLSGGFNYTRSPGTISGQPNIASTYNLIPGIVVSSNISENLDFSLSYMATKNIVRNTLRPDLDYNYFTHNAGLRLNWIFWEGFVFRTDLTHQLYTGLGEGYDQDLVLWNLTLAKKFLADNAAEVSFTLYDALDQNKGTSRNVTESYVEDQLSNVLNRYFVFTFTYNLKGFTQQQPPEQNPGRRRDDHF
jgi:hypothetical protein